MSSVFPKGFQRIRFLEYALCFYVLYFSGLLDKEEVGMVLKTLEGPDGMLKYAYTVIFLKCCIL